MLTVQQISKAFGIETILNEVSFTLNGHDRLGLVGPNGSGKTTLLRILAGQERPDAGVVRFNPPALRLGYLPQGFAPAPGETLDSFILRMEGDLPALTSRLEELAAVLARAPQRADLQEEYDNVLARLEAAAEGAGQGPATLAALGLGEMPPDTPVANLSGGQKTRLALAGVLLSTPQLLLLDEPTNHLDLAMLAWLEDWILAFQGGVLVVSHDRAFLDRVANGILELDAATHRLRAYPGNYSAYLEQKEAELARQRQEYGDQQEEIARLQAAARHLRGLARPRKGGKADTNDKFARGFFANRGLETVGRAKHLERRLDQLLNEDHVEKPRASWQMKIAFGETSPTGRDVVVLEDLSAGYGEQALLAGLNETVRYGERVALIGPNGCGKTTLLRTIAGSIPPVKGQARLGSGVRAGFMAQEQEELDPGADAFTSLRRQAAFSETDARAFLSYFLFTGDEVFTPVAKLSYGERARLSLACMVARGCNLLLLDEPVNHLDIASRARFEQALSAFEGTVIASAHDRYFIEGFASRVWEISAGGLHTREKL